MHRVSEDEKGVVGEAVAFINKVSVCNAEDASDDVLPQQRLACVCVSQVEGVQKGQAVCHSILFFFIIIIQRW